MENVKRVAYTIKETAEMLGLSYNTTRELVNIGAIPSFDLGNGHIKPRRRIPASAIEDLVHIKAVQKANRKEEE